MRPYRVAFILAPHRSGSTLLDNLLGNHPEVVSLGEADKLRAYALQDRRYYDPKQPLICSCGSPVPACAFWHRVQEALGTELAALSLQWPPTRHTYHALRAPERWVLDAGLSMLARRPGLLRWGLFRKFLGSDSVAGDNWRLFDAVHSVTGAACVVDASKSAYRYRIVRTGNETDIRAVYLCRDYRAVTHSLMRRGLSLEQAIARWRRSVASIEGMVRDVPDSQVLRLTYEAMCLDPAGTIQRACRFLELPGSTTLLSRSVADLHHISGSPSKFDPDRQAIRLDEAWAGAFSDKQLEYLGLAAQPYAQRWGYV
jgi:hypothetical protein